MTESIIPGKEVTFENNGTWYLLPWIVIDAILEEWYNNKYFTGGKESIDRLEAWIKSNLKTAQPNCIAELKDILNLGQEMEGLTSYKLYNTN